MTTLYTPSVQARGVRGSFFRALTGAERSSLVPLISEVISSDGADEKYAWIGESPQMVELLDEVAYKPLSDTTYTITNKIFKAGLVVRRKDLDDQQYNGITRRIQQLASVAVGHKNKMLVDALINGTSATLGLCYDGVALFHDAHPDRGVAGVGTQDNLLAGSGTTTANLQTDLNTGIQTMLTFKAENGEPFTESLDKLMIVAHPSMRKSVLEALNAQIISNTSNVGFAGLNIQPVFTPRLVDVNDWYMLNMSANMASLILQDRDPLEFSALESGERAQVQEQYLYECRWRGNVGYQFWQSGLKFVNT